MDFIVATLKPYVDKTYRTKPNAHNTALIGSSLGGLVSFYGALKYPYVFGKVGCFSPSFWFNRNEIFELMKKTKSFKTKVYFLCGDKEGDDDMINDLNKMEYQVNTKHNEKLWREGFKKAYLWLF